MSVTDCVTLDKSLSFYFLFRTFGMFTALHTI